MRATCWRSAVSRSVVRGSEPSRRSRERREVASESDNRHASGSETASADSAHENAVNYALATAPLDADSPDQWQPLLAHDPAVRLEDVDAFAGGLIPGERGVTVDYAIHPVAGRMPGHMNVLLAEANVPYEQLKEMDDINGEFKDADVVLVVGANDVVNPAAKTTPGAPIYGMPILNADEAQQIVFMKRSMRPGFAGIENELLFDPKTTLLFGDAKDSLGKLLSAVKTL